MKIVTSIERVDHEIETLINIMVDNVKNRDVLRYLILTLKRSWPEKVDSLILPVQKDILEQCTCGGVVSSCKIEPIKITSEDRKEKVSIPDKKEKEEIPKASIDPKNPKAECGKCSCSCSSVVSSCKITLTSQERKEKVSIPDKTEKDEIPKRPKDPKDQKTKGQDDQDGEIVVKGPIGSEKKGEKKGKDLREEEYQLHCGIIPPPTHPPQTTNPQFSQVMEELEKIKMTNRNLVDRIKTLESISK